MVAALAIQGLSQELTTPGRPHVQAGFRLNWQIYLDRPLRDLAEVRFLRGLIALEHGDPAAAAEHFRLTLRLLGRPETSRIGRSPSVTFNSWNSIAGHGERGHALSFLPRARVARPLTPSRPTATIRGVPSPSRDAPRYTSCRAPSASPCCSSSLSPPCRSWARRARARSMPCWSASASTTGNSGLNNPAYTENDVTALAEVLKQAGYKRVVLMTQTAGAQDARYLPTAAHIREELDGLLKTRRAGRHGAGGLRRPRRAVQGGQGALLLPADARLDKQEHAVPLDEVYKDLEKCQAGVKLLLVDACRNDPRSEFAGPWRRWRSRATTRPALSRPPGGVAALFSCSAGEKAYESPKLKHGVFFHYVIKGLRGEATERARGVTVGGAGGLRPGGGDGRRAGGVRRPGACNSRSC